MRLYSRGVWFPVLLAAVLQGAPVRLAGLPGDETEAAWSPDGRSVVFQWERDGDRDIAVLDLQSGQVRALVSGPGQACYPTWTPDGQSVIYSFGQLRTTAVQAVAQGLSEGFNLFRVRLDGGLPVPLTTGRVRDYLPRVNATADTLWFTSTRGLRQNSAGLFRLALNQAGAGPVAVLAADHASGGAVQPDPAPDGRVIAYACYTGIRSNWHLRLVRSDDPNRDAELTGDDWVAYAPRWSPDGLLIACTGYSPGDLGWGLYLVEARSGRHLRLDTGPGPARSPSWSPDGRELVFERAVDGGGYDLYRLQLPALSFPDDPAATPAPAAPVIRYRFAQADAGQIPDLSGSGNAAVVVGAVPWADGALCFGEGHLEAQAPRGCDFGTGPFYATVRLQVDRHTDALRLVIVGDYPEHHLGWQIFLNARNQVFFNARSPTGTFVGACSPGPFPTGRAVEVTGARDAEGRVRLYLDGVLTAEGRGATMSYGAPTQVRVGCQFDGGSRLPGRIESVEVGQGAPPCYRTRAQQLQEVFP